MSRKSSIALYIILSITGAILLIIASLLSISVKTNATSIDMLFVGIVFILSCVFGISLALKPNWTKNFRSKHGALTIGGKVEKRTNKLRRGHHPVCSRFQNHTITLNKNTYCAGCLGLVIGCSISILLMITYILTFSYLSLTLFVLAIFIGLIIITFSYIETIIPQRTGASHVASNVLLVIGLFFVVIGVFGTTKSPLIGAFAVVLSFLWLDTRVQLSRWNHEKICRDCRNSCKAY